MAVLAALPPATASSRGSHLGTAGSKLSSLVLGNNGVSPQPLVAASGTYDAADGYILMFGGDGLSGAISGATWTFTRGNWSALTPVGGVAPPGRFQAQMTFDAADGYVLLFGGCADNRCAHILGDTWSFAHGRWTNLTPSLASSPPARDLGSMVYDAADGYVVLFAGAQSNRSVLLGDAWTFHGGAWSPLVPTNRTAPTPSARAGAAMVYDGAANETVLFGGNSGTAVLGDTWSLWRGNWTNLTPTLGGVPLPRWAASATYDTATRQVLLVNGYDHGTLRSDTWGFGPSGWIALADAGGPDGSYGGLLVDDPGDGYVVYFSGIVSGASLYTPTLLYTSTGWQLLINPPGSSNFPVFDLLIPLVLFPALFGIMIPLSRRAQRRRMQRLGSGVDVVPGEVVAWTETAPGTFSKAPMVFAAAVMSVFPLAFLVPFYLTGPTLAGIVVFTALFVVVYGLLGFALYRSSAADLTQAVGVVRGGVIVRRRSGELRVAWENLQPSVLRPQRGRYFFQFIVPGRLQVVGGFSVSVEQARAIFLSGFAPAWIVARPVSDALGLPSRTPPVAGAPLPAAGPTTPLANPSGSSSAPLPPPPSPWGAAPRWPVAAPPPPPSSPPPPRLRASPQPVPPPGTTPCPVCGQWNPTGRVAFCQSCGARLV